MSRSCGTCNLCCKLPYVVELKKSIDTWCSHCKPGNGGCTIYADRPPSCRGFVCGWLSDKIEGCGDAWFPARCKMYIAARPPPHEGITMTVDPAFPNAWRREPYYSQLLEWAQQMPYVEIRVGRRFIGLCADGSESEITKTRDWIEASGASLN